MTVRQERLIADLSALAPEGFVALVADLWERCGWETARPDDRPGNAAGIVATQRTPVRQTHYLRVRRNPDETVDDREVRDFAAASLPRDADRRVIVTIAPPTPRVRELAADLDVDIVDGSGVSDLLDEHDATDLLGDADAGGESDHADHREAELFEAERKSDELEVLEASPFAEMEACPFCNSGRNNGAYFYPGSGRRTVDGGRLWTADVWNRADETATRNLRCDACSTNWVETGEGRESAWRLDSETRVRVGKREFVEAGDFPAATVEEWNRVDLDEGVVFPHPFEKPGSAFDDAPEPFDDWDACPECGGQEAVFVAVVDGRGRRLKCRSCERSWTERARLLRENLWRVDDPADAEVPEATHSEWERLAARAASD